MTHTPSHSHGLALEGINDLMDHSETLLKQAQELAADFSCVGGGDCGLLDSDLSDMETHLASGLLAVADVRRITELGIGREIDSTHRDEAAKLRAENAELRAQLAARAA
ncbi:hypothetical protein Q8791_23060 [Nocardiopsis sp. CT-R113]|uniref:Uncharacterized protein n=1 Tax=Nocardiopsis codii TaxID=3065942 RepID=A0ABU7KCZ1_9ACTN|nr:hypothetical protein [Nocardiopsis sp. CT-R113]MEE2040101.1 hypothetical protein [Nocardiopsis sp. CT-R113]